jgi:acetylornithine deacetylase/succinyl-diaminopimelate desuccinylase-like protein
VVKGTSGHGSIPRPDNPIVHLAAAIAKLGELQPHETKRDDAHVLSTPRAYQFAGRWCLHVQPLEDPVLGPSIQEKLRTTKLTLNSMLRTSISPTIVKGGFRSNVIPGDAEATLDIRALPDEDMGEFPAMLRRVINDPAVEAVGQGGSGRAKSSPVTAGHGDVSRTRKAQATVLPVAVTLPMMVTGATDAAQLRAKGVQVYGVGSVDEGVLHGNDERIPIDEFNKFLEIVYRAVVDVASGKITRR